jgi:hypothetical protein
MEEQMPILAGRFYGSIDYLFWWAKGQRLPPLVTSGPDLTLSGAATAGVLGVHGTTVVFGNRRVDDDGRSGGRFTTGYWFDPAQTVGLEVGALYLATTGTGFAASSPGSPILSQPFILVTTTTAGGTTTTTQTENAHLVASFTQAGSAFVSTKNELWGAEGNARFNVGGGTYYRTDLLAGFRYLRVKDGLQVSDLSTPLNGNFIPVPNQPQLVAAGPLSISDTFTTRNDFYGGQVGAHIEVKRNALFADFLAKLALGVTHEAVDIIGTTTATNTVGFGGSPGTTVFPGGLFAQPGQNLGHHSRNVFAIAPEVGVNVGYQFGEHLRAYVGYSVLYIRSGVVRTATQFDRLVAAPGSQLPAFNFRDQDYWAQGVNGGVEVSF